MYKVSEIFQSIDGEGVRTGQPVNFIRLAGCNLRCSYCDTSYALFGEEEPCRYDTLCADEIIEKLNPLFKRVTLTGGEPLIAKGVSYLAQRLQDEGYELNVETNGAVDICKFESELSSRGSLFFTIDYKLPSSGMEGRMIWNNFLNLTPRDAVKFVVGSDADADCMVSVAEKMKAHYKTMPQIFVGAVFGMYDLKKLTQRVLSEPVLCDAKLQIQLHKIIWDPNERGV